MNTRTHAAKPRAPKTKPGTPTAKPRPPKARFFFALRPDAEAAATLAASARRLADAFGGKPLAAHDLHLTLVFVGMRPIEDAQRLAAMLEVLPLAIAGSRAMDRPGLHKGEDPLHEGHDALRGGETLPLVLSEIGSFGHGVLWAGPDRQSTGVAQGGAAARLLSQWAGLLQQRLRAEGIDFDGRPLRPHVTLVRGARGVERQELVPPAEPALWSLALGASGSGSTPERRYRWVSRAAVTPP